MTIESDLGKRMTNVYQVQLDREGWLSMISSATKPFEEQMCAKLGEEWEEEVLRPLLERAMGTGALNMGRREDIPVILKGALLTGFSDGNSADNILKVTIAAKFGGLFDLGQFGQTTQGTIPNQLISHFMNVGAVIRSGVSIQRIKEVVAEICSPTSTRTY